MPSAASRCIDKVLLVCPVILVISRPAISVRTICSGSLLAAGILIVKSPRVGLGATKPAFLSYVLTADGPHALDTVSLIVLVSAELPTQNQSLKESAPT